MRTASLARSSLVVASLTAGLTGCAFEVASNDIALDDERFATVATDEPYRPIRSATDGRLAGAIGPVTNLDHAANALSTYDDGYYLSVETVVQLEDRAVMTLLSVSQGAELFQPGLHATFSLDDVSQGGLALTLLGCVGEEVGVYALYDSPADEVDVDVDTPVDAETDDELDVTLLARWYDRDADGNQLETFESAATAFTLQR